MIDLFFIFIREHTHTQIGKRKMVMNKDTRFGMGTRKITFDMNIGWFDHMIYEIDGWYEKDDTDDDEVMELYEHAEQLITWEMENNGVFINIDDAEPVEIYNEIFMKDDVFVELLPKYYTRDN